MKGSSQYRPQGNSRRSIDTTGQAAYEKLGKHYSLVSNKRIATWKSLSLITFFAGLMAASIWFVSYRLEQDSIVISTKMFSLADSQEKEKPEKGGIVGRADDRILVKFKKDVALSKRQAILDKQGLKEKSEIKEIGVKIVQLPAGRVPEDVIQRLMENDKASVEFAEVDALMAPAYIPNDTLYPNQWHSTKMNLPAAWDTSKGSGVVVAVLDTGTNCNHPDLSVNCVAGWNFYDNNNNTSDPHGHGTSVAGTVAAIGENTAGVAGTAYQAKIMPIRISDPTGYASWSTVANGVIWAADHGARVASNSYRSSDSLSVQNAAAYLRSKNGIFVASAGNQGTLLGGDVLSVVTVGATGSSDTKASWSNYGQQVDVVAPGVGIYTTTSSGGYGAVSGTSFSAPNAAAVLALLFSVKPGLSPSQAESILESTALDLGTSGRDDYYGNGRVDAAKAIAAALDTVGTTDTTPPTPPSNLSATVGTKSVALTWSVASDNVGVTGYKISRDNVQIATSSTTNYTDNSVITGGTYNYLVKATDAAGNTSGSSNTVTVSIPPDTAPFAINDLSGTSSTSTTGTISWTTNLGSTGVVKYGTNQNALTTTVSSTQTGTAHTVNLTGLTKKTRYYYQVTATGPNGEVVTSAKQSFMTRPK